MKKIFGHIYFYDSSSPFLGRSVADKDFLIALLRYGQFDEYHFFCESDQIQADLQKIISEAALSGEQHNKIKTFYLFQLEQQVTSTEYTVFHATDPVIDKLLHMRNTYRCAAPFAVTGYTHTLSSRNLAPAYLLTLMQAPGAYDAIICSSDCGRQVMHKIYAHLSQSFQTAFGRDLDYQGQFPHIPLGINVSTFGRLTQAEARQKLGFPLEVKLVLSIARLSPSSKMDYYPLLDVFAQVKHKIPNSKLILAGGMTEEKENYLQELQRYCTEKNIAQDVILYPNFPPEHKPLLYRAADVFVSPSDNLQETFGLTILEALASELPVVCSDWNGYKELIQDGINGYKIPTILPQNNPNLEHFTLFSLNPGYVVSQFTSIDQPQMTARILDILTAADPGIMRQQAAKSVQPYDWAQIIPQFETLWKKLNQQARQNWHPGQYNLAFPLLDIFSHYSTHTLKDSHHVMITHLGKDVLANKQMLSINKVIQNHLNFNLLAAILNVLKQGTDVAIGDLKHQLKEFADHQVESHLIWLHKYHAVAINHGF